MCESKCILTRFDKKAYHVYLNFVFFFYRLFGFDNDTKSFKNINAIIDAVLQFSLANAMEMRQLRHLVHMDLRAFKQISTFLCLKIFK